MNQASNPFGTLSTDGLEAARDVLGGGNAALESDVYSGTIVHAFAGESQGGARSFTIRIQFGDRAYDETLYVTNKLKQNFYEKGGKKNPLPGFTTANDLALLSTGNDLASQTFEEKVLKLWDYDAKAELPKKVMVATDMIGLPITVAILKKIEDKTKKNDNTGEYEPTGEFRDVNAIDKVFHTESGKTLSEFVAKKDAEFQGKWLEKNKGVTQDRSKGLAGKTGAPGATRSAPSAGGGTAAPGNKKSLFG